MNKQAIAEHCSRYPELEIGDIFKFIYQSSFGCEHFVTDEAEAVDHIRREYSLGMQDRTCGAEVLNGDFCRVHLDVLAHGLSPQTLGRLFVLSSRKKGDGALQARLAMCRAMAAEGEFPFTEAAFLKAADAWEAEGFPPCHHSESFRRLYHPAYRVIEAEYVRVLPLLQAIDKGLCRGSIIVSIEGRCGSGKTTLGELLSSLYNCNVFHMDDFFLQPFQRTEARLAVPGENVDHERFLEQVLLPTVHRETVHYCRYNCQTGEIEDGTAVEPKPLTVVEGSYSQHSSLAPYYDIKVFLDITAEEQRQRILRRNPQKAQMFFHRWIPLEETYFAVCDVREKADLVL